MYETYENRPLQIMIRFLGKPPFPEAPRRQFAHQSLSPAQIVANAVQKRSASAESIWQVQVGRSEWARVGKHCEVCHRRCGAYTSSKPAIIITLLAANEMTGNVGWIVIPQSCHLTICIRSWELDCHSQCRSFVFCIRSRSAWVEQRLSRRATCFDCTESSDSYDILGFDA